MPSFVVASGWDAEPDIIDAPSLEAARAKAVEFSMAKGLSAEDAGNPEHSWARPYTEDLAYELGLVHYDEREVARLAWRAQAPWR